VVAVSVLNVVVVSTGVVVVSAGVVVVSAGVVVVKIYRDEAVSDVVVAVGPEGTDGEVAVSALKVVALD